MNEAVLLSIQSARAAALASYRALTALEELITKSDEAEEPEEVDDGSCKHSEAIEVYAGSSRWLVCPCGHQQEL